MKMRLKVIQDEIADWTRTVGLKVRQNTRPTN